MTEPLPMDVVAALKDGKKIEAIKRLREANSMQLKDAKDAVDAYTRARPEQFPQYVNRGGSGLMPLIGLILAILLLVGAFIVQQ